MSIGRFLKSDSSSDYKKHNNQFPQLELGICSGRKAGSDLANKNTGATFQ